MVGEANRARVGIDKMDNDYFLATLLSKLVNIDDDAVDGKVLENTGRFKSHLSAAMKLQSGKSLKNRSHLRHLQLVCSLVIDFREYSIRRQDFIDDLLSLSSTIKLQTPTLCF